MEAVFLKILNMSLSASVVIVVVLFVRLLLRKAPKKWSYLLWLVVAFRLCFPVSIESMFSIFSVAPLSSAAQPGGMEYIPPDIGRMAQPRLNIGTARISEAIPSSLPAPEPAAGVNPLQIWIAAGTVLWGVGVTALLIYGLIRYFRMRRALADAVRVRDNIFEADLVRSPFILGLFRPKIYLPFGLDGDILTYVLAHEEYHIRRKDHLVKLFSFLLLSIHWFNPLVWLAFYLMGRDMEMSCDEKVLAGQDGIAKSYGMALLSFAANRRFPVSGPLTFGEFDIRSRIKNVLNWKRPRTWATLAAALVCIVAVAACGTNPPNEAEEITPQPESTVSSTEEASSGQAQVPSPEPLRALTLEELVRMALEAEGDLRWEDFAGFSCRDESSPPFLRRRYEIDDVYSVLVSGSGETGAYLSGVPAYIYLYYGPNDGDKINVRWIGVGATEAGFAEFSVDEITKFFVSEIRSQAEYVLPVNVLRGFPSLFVGDASGSIDALAYCGEHYYDISAYTEYNNIGGGGTIFNPLEERVHGLGPNVLRRAAGSSAFLLFDVDTVPDEVTVRCWPDDSWGDLENEGESVPVTYDAYYSFPLKDGSYIYDITVSWDHWGLPENYWWTVHYIFIGDTTQGVTSDTQ